MMRRILSGSHNEDLSRIHVRILLWLHVQGQIPLLHCFSSGLAFSCFLRSLFFWLVSFILLYDGGAMDALVFLWALSLRCNSLFLCSSWGRSSLLVCSLLSIWYVPTNIVVMRHCLIELATYENIWMNRSDTRLLCESFPAKISISYART